VSRQGASDVIVMTSS